MKELNGSSFSSNRATGLYNKYFKPHQLHQKIIFTTKNVGHRKLNIISFISFSVDTLISQVQLWQDAQRTTFLITHNNITLQNCSRRASGDPLCRPSVSACNSRVISIHRENIISCVPITLRLFPMFPLPLQASRRVYGNDYDKQ